MGCICTLCKKKSVSRTSQGSQNVQNAVSFPQYRESFNSQVEMSFSTDSSKQFMHCPNYEQIKYNLSRFNSQIPSNLWYAHYKDLENYPQILSEYLNQLQNDSNDKDLLNQQVLILQVTKGKLIDKDLLKRCSEPQLHISLQLLANDPKTEIKPAIGQMLDSVMEFDYTEVVDITQKLNPDLQKNSMKIKLTFLNKSKKKRIQVGDEQTYLFSELQDQFIKEKMVSFTKSASQIRQSYVQVRAQLVHNRQKHIKWWKDEMVTRLEQIDNIQKFIQEQKKKQPFINNQQSPNAKQFSENESPNKNGSFDQYPSFISQNGEAIIGSNNSSYYNSGYVFK